MVSVSVSGLCGINEGSGSLALRRNVLIQVRCNIPGVWSKLSLNTRGRAVAWWVNRWSGARDEDSRFLNVLVPVMPVVSVMSLTLVTLLIQSMPLMP